MISSASPEMTDRNSYKFIKYFIATIWLINGLFCKVLNLVPRHGQIVSRILGDEYSALFTNFIGTAEIFMAIWILSGIKSRLNAMTQIFIVALMNIIELILVPDLLLWGKVNVIFALLFILIIFYNEFFLNRKIAKQT